MGFTRALRVAWGIAAMSGAACGLSIEGSFATGDASAPPADGGAADVTNGDSDGAASADAAADASPASDAAGDAPDACAPLVFEDSFDAGIGAQWVTTGATAANAATSLTGPYVTLLPIADSNHQGALFYATPEPMAAFVVSFRFRVDMPVGGVATNIGDGFAFQWLDTTGNLGAQIGAGAALGIPPNPSGWALAFDAYKNTAIADPNVPYYGILRVETSKGQPGSYDWHVSSASTTTAVYGAWHTASVTSLSGSVTAAIDGANVLNGVAASSAYTGMFGFTAASGGAAGVGVALDEVRIELPNPACPSAFP